jgi:hypothetical protein
LEQCDVSFEIGAYLFPVARARSSWIHPKFHVIVDPSAAKCSVQNDTKGGGPMVLEVPTLVADFWSELRDGIENMANGQVRLCMIWLGFAGMPIPSLGSKNYSPNKANDAVGVFDTNSAKAFHEFSNLMRLIIVEGPGSHCNGDWSKRCPHASCGPQWMTNHFGKRAQIARYYDHEAQMQNSIEASKLHTFGFKHPWKVQDDCLGGTSKFPCLWLQCGLDVKDQPPPPYGLDQLNRHLLVFSTPILPSG